MRILTLSIDFIADAYRAPVLLCLSLGAVLFATMCFSPGSAVAADSAYNPQHYREIIQATPYMSAGLTPVEFKRVEGVELNILAKNGKAQMKIVVPPKSVYYRQIAELLKRYLDQATGADFEIVSEIPADKAIFVGPVDSPEIGVFWETATQLPPDSFLVASFAKGIVLVGNDHDRAFDIQTPLSVDNLNDMDGLQYCSKGTLHAATDFLERFVGIRWYFWGPLYTCVPDLTTTTLMAPAVSYQDGPVFPVRQGGYAMRIDERVLNYRYMPDKYKVSANQRLFWERVLMKQGDSLGCVPNHTDGNWQQFYADRPELFALRPDGTRMTGQAGREDFSSQRCYSSEAGFQEHLKAIEAYLKDKKDPGKFSNRLMGLPNDKYIYWVPNDAFRGCVCEDCLKKVDRDAPPDQTTSRLIWDYAIRLANAIKERWPDHKLCVLSYQSYDVIPPGVKLPDNLLVTSCLTMNIPVCYMKEPAYLQVNQKRLDTLVSQVAHKPVLWLYYPHLPFQLNRIPIPYFSPHVQTEFLRSNRDEIRGAFMNKGLIQNELNAQAVYVYWKTLWNPDFDIDAYLGEFAALMYGPAAVPMKQYIDLAVDRWEKTRWPELPATTYSLSQNIPSIYYWKYTYPREVRQEMRGLLEQALAQTPEGSIYHDRVKLVIASAAPFFSEGDLADGVNRSVIECMKLDAEPIVDGNLSDWEKVRPVQLQTVDGEPENVKTQIYTAFDGKYFYIAGHVSEPNKMRLPDNAEVMDDIFRNDSIEIFVCPTNETSTVSSVGAPDEFYQIALNGAGTVVVLHKSPQMPNGEVLKDFDLSLAVQPFGNGFQFELAIPYASMNVEPPVVGQSRWRANFYRNRPRGEDRGYLAWSPTRGGPFRDTSRFGEIQFVKPPLYSLDLNQCSRYVARSENLDAKVTVENGNAVLKIKALPSLHEDVVPYVQINNLPSFKLDKPVLVEWVFRYRGKGVKNVLLVVKESYGPSTDKQHSAVYTYSPATDSDDQVDTDWIHGSLLVSPGKYHMKDIKFCDFEARVAPGADFELEVGYIRYVAP